MGASKSASPSSGGRVTVRWQPERGRPATLVRVRRLIDETKPIPPIRGEIEPMVSKRQVGKSVQVGFMQSNSRRHWRLRPEPDPIYLAALAQRVAAAFGLPLKTAKARVKQLAASAAGAARDPGSDARF